MIRFEPKGLYGRFSDRLQLSFLDKGLDQSFSISRELVAVVGNKQELDALAPIAPFVRPKRQIREEPVHVVDGIKYTFDSDIQWVVKLPRFEVPKYIHQTLAVGSPDEQITQVRDTLLPSSVNSQTYSRFWSTLLHVEEVRMTCVLSRAWLRRTFMFGF